LRGKLKISLLSETVNLPSKSVLKQMEELLALNFKKENRKLLFLQPSVAFTEQNVNVKLKTQKKKKKKIRSGLQK